MKIGIKKTIYNYDLKQMRSKAGMTQEELCDKCGINLQRYSKIECLKTFPYEFEAYMIADYFGVEADILFPQWSMGVYKNNRRIIDDVVTVERMSLSSPEILAIEDTNTSREIDEDALKDSIKKSFDILSDREVIVLSNRFGLDGTVKNIEEIGVMLNVSRERVRQIMDHALRKLKYGTKKKDLMDFINY